MHFRGDAARSLLDLETTHANMCCNCLPVAFQTGRANAILEPHATLGKVHNGIPSSHSHHVRFAFASFFRLCDSCVCVPVFVCAECIECA